MQGIRITYLYFKKIELYNGIKIFNRLLHNVTILKITRQNLKQP